VEIAGREARNLWICEFPLDVQLLRWEIVWRNAPRIRRDFGSALPFQTGLTQIKQVLPLSNGHGSQVKDQGRWLFCHNKHKNFPIGLHVTYLYFLDTPRSFASKSRIPKVLCLDPTRIPHCFPLIKRTVGQSVPQNKMSEIVASVLLKGETLTFWRLTATIRGVPHS